MAAYALARLDRDVTGVIHIEAVASWPVTEIGTTRRRPLRRRPKPRYWSQHVTETSNALDLEPNVFTKSSARAIARSLKRSSESSTRRKGGAYQAAMSMLSFYMNRAGRNLSPERKRVLERAKLELRRAFGRTSSR